MVDHKEVIWPADEHTLAKIEILRNYLAAWFPILNRYHGRIVYIDGFCGPGKYSGGQPGSPIVALKVAAEHRTPMKGNVQFWFIEKDADRLEHLRSEVKPIQYPNNFLLSFENCEFYDVMDDVLSSIEKTDEVIAPTFAFIDPCGFKGIPFSIIKRLLSQPRCEVFITLMVDWMNRFISLPEVCSHVVSTFGTKAVNDVTNIEVGKRVSWLVSLYAQQLKDQANARFVRDFAMYSSQNRHIYSLLFAGNNRLGHAKMKEAMRKVDQTGSYSFKDCSNPDQPLLFNNDELEAGILKEEIHNHFRGEKAVLGGSIKEYVEDCTGSTNAIKTIALKLLKTEGRLKVDSLKKDGKPYCKGFPDNAIITFV